MSEEAVWMAWVIAHHATGCAERNRVSWENCRYRAAHIKTAKLIAELLYEQGYRLVKVEREAESLPLFGAS
jgi:hypothetical protein